MGTFVVGAIVVLCILAAVRSMVRDKRNGKSCCSGGCSKCKGHCN